MNENNMQEVYFDVYCKKCKYAELDGWKDPCNDCLSEGMNDGSHKPVCYEEAEK